MAQIAVASINVEPDRSHLANPKGTDRLLHITGYSTLDENHAGELANRFPGDQVALGAGEKAMGEGGADAAAIQVDDASVLAAGEDDALVEGIMALGIDEPGALQPIEGIALGEEVTPQASPWGITDLQFLNQGGVAQSALFQILAGLWVVIELLSIESRSLLQHSGSVRQRALLFEVSEALAEG